MKKFRNKLNILNSHWPRQVTNLKYRLALSKIKLIQSFITIVFFLILKSECLLKNFHRKRKVSDDLSSLLQGAFSIIRKVFQRVLAWRECLRDRERVCCPLYRGLLFVNRASESPYIIWWDLYCVENEASGVSSP